MFMKTIIYNNDNLNDNDINNLVRRSKAIIINSNNQILFAKSHGTYFFVGGRVEENENFDEGLIREVKEETGITLPLKVRVPILNITYMNKDYPRDGINTKSVANYYLIECDDKPDLNKMDLTEEEKSWDFELVYVDKKDSLKVLEKSLKESKNKNVVSDTLNALKVFLNK